MLPQPREESSSVAQWQSPDKVGINRLPLAARATVRKVYARPSGEIRNTFQRSSVVERSAVNRLVVGSNPTAGAKPQGYTKAALRFAFCVSAPLFTHGKSYGWHGQLVGPGVRRILVSQQNAPGRSARLVCTA